jgi:hypothetical protein
VNRENRGAVIDFLVEERVQLKVAQGRGEGNEVAVDLGGGGRVVGKEPAQFDGVVQFLLGRSEAGDELFQGIDLRQSFLGCALVIPEIRGGSLLL